jgi:hypothetical protein
MARLLHISAKSEAFKWGPSAHNFRNFHINRVETALGDPTRFHLPRSGSIQCDFLEYSPFVLIPCASPEKWHPLAVNLHGLQLAAESHMHSLKFLLEAFARMRTMQQAEAWDKQKLALMSTMKTKGKRKEGKKSKTAGKTSGKAEGHVRCPALFASWKHPSQS